MELEDNETHKKIEINQDSVGLIHIESAKKYLYFVCLRFTMMTVLTVAMEIKNTFNRKKTKNNKRAFS